jgi:nicotinamide-nucleotide amidase
MLAESYPMLRLPESPDDVRSRQAWGTTGAVHDSSESFPLDDGDAWDDLVGARRVGCAESCTGGQVAQLLARIPGSSEWFRGGLVAYQTSLKVELLGITPGPVVTERAANEMAVGAAHLLGADATVAVTGAAGPEPLDGAPPGTVVIATFVDGVTTGATCTFPGSPEAVCERAALTAVRRLSRHLACCGAPSARAG